MTGLTGLICDLIRDRLTTANPDALARKYAIRADHARFYLLMWRNK